MMKDRKFILIVTIIFILIIFLLANSNNSSMIKEKKERGEINNYLCEDVLDVFFECLSIFSTNEKSVYINGYLPPIPDDGVWLITFYFKTNTDKYDENQSYVYYVGNYDEYGQGTINPLVYEETIPTNSFFYYDMKIPIKNITDINISIEYFNNSMEELATYIFDSSVINDEIVINDTEIININEERKEKVLPLPSIDINQIYNISF